MNTKPYFPTFPETDDGKPEPAFPHHRISSNGESHSHYSGMSLRDWFAGQALGACIQWAQARGKDELMEDNQPVHAEPCMPDGDAGRDGTEDAARAAYLFADAMLAARSKEAGK